MARCVDQYVPRTGGLRIVEVGSRRGKDQARTPWELFDGYDCEYIGVDIVNGPNVDRVMTKPYRLPLRANSADVVLSGQVFEHIPFVWVSMAEIARVLKPNGHGLITAPSRGHRHGTQDCWRFYPDGMRALAAWSGLELLEASTDFPPQDGTTRRHDFSAIDADHYWGDTVGVFRKPVDYRRVRMAAVRSLTKLWANRARAIDIRDIPPGRRSVTICSVGCLKPRPPCSSTLTSTATRPPRSSTSATTGTPAAHAMVSADDRSLRIDAGLTVSFNTYFNSFYASYWKDCTSVSTVTLRVQLAGRGVVTAICQSRDGSIERGRSRPVRQCHRDDRRDRRCPNS